LLQVAVTISEPESQDIVEAGRYLEQILGQVLAALVADAVKLWGTVIFI
jgi:hypothetical protein